MLAIVTAAGLSAILVSSVIAFSVVKYLGAAYLIYLGIRRLLARAQPAKEMSVRAKSLRRDFGQGFLIGISNPKTRRRRCSSSPSCPSSSPQEQAVRLMRALRPSSKSRLEIE